MKRNILITGINGFIGGNLAKALLENGANIFGLIRNQKKNTMIYYENHVEKITLIQGEMIDKDLLERIISEEHILRRLVQKLQVKSLSNNEIGT